jgi:hypothetical protein
MLRTEPRFPSVDRKAGHYESFYIKACHPAGGRGIWLRHTVHKRPGEEPKASIWLTIFDGEADGPRATKATYPADQLAAPERGYIRVAECELDDGRATGSIATDAMNANWELTFRDDSEPFYFLPRQWMYRAPVPRTKFLSPYPNAKFSGSLQAGDDRLILDRWPGMIGHNWGTEHAERWVWIQGAGFHDRPGTYFDAGAARIKVGPWTVPWIGNGRLVLDGKQHRLGGLERIRSTKLRDEPTRCEIQLSGEDGVKVKGVVSAPAKDFVAWVYADPKGPEHNTLNCSISDLELEVERSDKPVERLTLSGGAAYEIGMRETDHGIPVQPYPDG